MVNIEIYCFGSDIDEGDMVAFDVADYLCIDGVEFIKMKDPNSMYDLKLDDVIIMDAVKGINFVKLFDDLSILKTNNPYSAHDFDLSLFLQLMQQMGKIGKMKIIGIPYGKKVKEIKNDLINTIKELKDK